MYYIDYHGYYLFYILSFWKNKTLILLFTQKCLLTLGKNKVEKNYPINSQLKGGGKNKQPHSAENSCTDFQYLYSKSLLNWFWFFRVCVCF